MADLYTYQLEQALEAILEEFEQSHDLGFDMFDPDGNPVKVSESLASALEHAQKLIYAEEETYE